MLIIEYPEFTTVGYVSLSYIIFRSISQAQFNILFMFGQASNGFEQEHAGDISGQVHFTAVLNDFTIIAMLPA